MLSEEKKGRSALVSFALTALVSGFLVTLFYTLNNAKKVTQKSQMVKKSDIKKLRREKMIENETEATTPEEEDSSFVVENNYEKIVWGLYSRYLQIKHLYFMH